MACRCADHPEPAGHAVNMARTRLQRFFRLPSPTASAPKNRPSGLLMAVAHANRKMRRAAMGGPLLKTLRGLVIPEAGSGWPPPR